MRVATHMMAATLPLHVTAYNVSVLGSAKVDVDVLVPGEPGSPLVKSSHTSVVTLPSNSDLQPAYSTSHNDEFTSQSAAIMIAGTTTDNASTETCSGSMGGTSTSGISSRSWSSTANYVSQQSPQVSSFAVAGVMNDSFANYNANTDATSSSALPVIVSAGPSSGNFTGLRSPAAPSATQQSDAVHPSPWGYIGVLAAAMYTVVIFC